MQAAELRPLSVGEKLDVAIKIYWRNALTLFRVVLVVVAPVQIITALILASAIPDAETVFGQPSLDPGQPAVDPTFEASEIWAFVAGIALIVIVSFIASTLATAACFKAVSDAYLGGQPNWKTSLAFAGRRLHSVLWISILGGLLTFGLIAAAGGLTALLGALDEMALWIGIPLLIAAFVVAVWMWIGWVAAVPAFLTEGTKGRRALGRSFRLVKGRWWRTFGLYLLATFLAGFVGNTIGTILTALQFTDVGESFAMRLTLDAIGQTIAAVVTTPFIAAFIIVLYFDLRVRNEGFDLQLLAERVGLAPGSVGVLRPMTDYLPQARPTGGGQPPFWPPPPGWQPDTSPPPPTTPPTQQAPLWSGGTAPGRPSPDDTEASRPPDRSAQPPFWPPPPGWEPPPEDPAGR